MTDAHCHVIRGESRCFIASPTHDEPRGCDAVFYGRHPWEFLDGGVFSGEDAEKLEKLLEDNPSAGVGEIGLDRLKTKTVPDAMREAFRTQLALAARHSRNAVVHGAKCWGETVKECIPFAGAIPAFLFHGFSRSGGLVPDIVAINGYISVGPAILNDHATNYRELVKRLPVERILVESDATAENADDTPSVEDTAVRLASLLGMPPDVLERRLEANADAFLGAR